MTENEWVNCKDPERMLIYLSHRADLLDRKLRLVAAVCCYRLWDWLPGEGSRRAVQASERYAEGLSGKDELQREERNARTEQYASPSRVGTLAAAAAAEAAGERTWSAARKASLQASWCVGERGGLQAGIAERHLQCDLLRDIFGDPFRPAPAVSPAWLSWDGGTVRRLAEAAYTERQLPAGTLDQARLAVLADALEEAGCQEAYLLDHLRGPGPHVRGCFVLDALLGLS